MPESSRTIAHRSTAIEGSFPPRRETNLLPRFGVVARALWPTKTAFHLAAIAGTSDRAAKDWLNGKVDPPARVIAAIVVEITRRD